MRQLASSSAAAALRKLQATHNDVELACIGTSINYGPAANADEFDGCVPARQLHSRLAAR